MINIDLLKKFRQQVYLSFPVRRDTNMNLLDAISSYGHRCKSVVDLSEAPCFERQYSSITDGIADGLCEAKWDEITQLSYAAIKSDNDRVILVTDCTPQPRPYAKRLADRHITHAPNPAPGNKPICVGHQYSVVSLQPESTEAKSQHWLPPLSVQRVESAEKGNEVGMQQLSNCINQLPLENKLIISIADSLYGTENCRQLVSKQSNWVHLFRVNSTRNVFAIAPPEGKHRGSKKRYADKMKLNDTATHVPSDDIVQKTIVSKRGKTYHVTLHIWYDRIVRGSRQFKGYAHPMTLLQITLTDEENKAAYKAPLWLGMIGKRRREVSALQAYDYYDRRYDIEHFFRFGKANLLLDVYQTPDVTHELNWWHLSCLAYVQLYLARQCVPLLPKKWERYLPNYQSKQGQLSLTATPSQTQRAFDRVLEQTSTPARPCKARGNPKGRAVGEIQPKRPIHKMIFKGKNKHKKMQKTMMTGSDNLMKNSDTQKITDLVETIKNQLKKIGISPEQFYKQWLNAT